MVSSGSFLPDEYLIFNGGVMKKKGFTLVELLCLLGVLAILSTISVPILKRADAKSRSNADNAMVSVYKQAIESFRLNDYSTLSTVPNKRVTVEENGRVKFNSELNMTGDEIEALKNSGKGIYPQTREECLAAIKVYTGSKGMVLSPSKGSSFEFYYDPTNASVFVSSERDLPIAMREHLIILSGD